jgi:MFS family permease
MSAVSGPPNAADVVEHRDAIKASARTSAYAWYVAGMLSMAYLLSIMDRYLLSVVLEDVKRGLAVTDTQLGILQGPSFVFLFLVASVPIGRLADVASRRLIVVAGLACWSVFTFACGLADSFAELFVARLGVGLGEAALLPCAMSLIAAYFPRSSLGRGIAVYSMGSSFGRVAAFAGGGALFGWFGATGGLRLLGGHYSAWQAVFVVAGLIGVAFALVFLVTVREPPRVVRAERTGAVRAGFVHFWRHRWAYLAVCIPFSMSAATAMQLAAWTVSFYGRTHHMTAASASALVGFTGLLSGPIGHLSGGWINDFLRARGLRGPQPLVLVGVLLVATTFVALFTMAGSIAVAATAYGIAYFALCVAGPTGFSGMQLPTPDSHRGFISSLFLFVYTALGTGLGPLVVGLFTDHFFHNEALLGRSMITTSVLLMAIGLPFAILGRRAFTRAVEANEAATDAA